MHPMCNTNRAVVLLIILLGIAQSWAQAIPDQDDAPSPHTFWIVTHQQAMSEAFGCVMVCPAHDHGTSQEAFEKLQGLLANKKPPSFASIWICRANQTRTLEQFVPLVDQVGINPFTELEKSKPPADTALWPGYDHPVINRIRHIRMIAGDKRLIAKLPLAGDSIFFDKRPACIEEIEWMLFAVIGGHFQGIATIPKLSTPAAEEQYRAIVNALHGLADSLATAEPVAWIQTEQSTPASALLASSMLFIAHVNPAFMTPVSTSGKGFELPLDPQPFAAAVTLRVPAPFIVERARNLAGLLLPIQDVGGGVRVTGQILGGGDLWVLDLRQRHGDQAP